MIAPRIALTLVAVAFAGLALGIGQSAQPAAPTPPPAPAPVPIPTPAPTPPVKRQPMPPAVPPKPDSKPADVTRFSFLTGAWRGYIGSELVEEVWSAPSGNHLMGMFRWMGPDGNIRMSELLSITGEPGVARLRLMHFDPALRTREPGDKPLILRLAMIDGDRAEFVAEEAESLERVVYQRTGDELAIDVIFKQGDKPRKPLQFRLTRSALDAK
ncbi:MAG: DUF6265 family protein [Phycisphaerales bacterium]